MKKMWSRRATSLVMLFALLMTSIGTPAAETPKTEVAYEGEEILYQTDFEDWEDDDLTPLYNTVPESSDFLVWCTKLSAGKDSEKGLSPIYGRMEQPQRVLDFMPQPLPESGIYHYRFDFKAGTSETTRCAIVFSRGDIVATVFDKSVLTKWGLNWYHIDIMLDYDAKTWSATATPYDENGETDTASGSITRIPNALRIDCATDDMSKRNSNTIPIMDNFCYSRVITHKKPVNVKSVTSQNEGNIFELNDEVVLDINLLNRSAENVDAEITAEVTNKKGDLLWTQTYTERFAGDESKTVSVNPQNLNTYDIYTMKVTTNGRYSDMADFETEPSTFTTDFSKVWKVPKDKMNDKYGTATLGYMYGWSETDGVATAIAADAGIVWNRDEVQWRECEKEKGVYKIPDSFLNDLKKAKAAGMKNQVGLFYNNPIYAGSSIPVPVGDELTAYYNFCEWFIKETKGLVDAYCVWNEYNHVGFNPNYETPEYYVEMLKTVYGLVKQYNPDALVLGLESAGIVKDFNERVFAAGGAQYMDVAAVHPYDWSGHFDTKSIMKQCNEMKETMAKYGEVVPIWWTEFGFSAAYSDDAQANGLVMAYCLQECYDVADTTFQFRMQDDLDNAAERERKWGFIRDFTDPERPNAAKPSYLAISAMNNLIGSMSEAQEVINDGTDYAFRFWNNDLQKDVAVLIGEFDSTYRSFDFGCGTIDIYDIYGNKLRTAASDNGVFSFAVGAEPVYAVGSFTKFEETDNSRARVLPLNLSEIAVNGETVTFSFEKNTSVDLKIVPEENEFLTVKEITPFIGGKASVTFNVAENFNEDTKIAISLTDNDGNVHYTREHEVIFDPLDISITTERASGDNHWRAVVSVTNHSKVSTIAGTITTVGPEREAAYIAPRSFKALGPGEHIVFYLNLPEMVIKNTIDLELKVDLTNGYSEIARQKLDFSSAEYADRKPVIDGEYSVEEWHGNWFGADKAEHYGSDDYSGNKVWGGPEDSSFTGITMWDEENLYVLLDAVDDVHYINAVPGGATNMWRVDCIQFAIDDRDQSALNPVGTDKFTELGIGDVPNEGATAWRYSAFYDLPTETYVTDCDIAIVRKGNHTVYECRFPWKELLGEQFEAAEGKVVSFSIVLNDSDIGNRGWIMYNGGITPNKNIQLFGSLTLTKNNFLSD